MRPYRYHQMYHEASYWGRGLFFLLLIAALAAGVTAIVLLLRQRAAPTPSPSSPEAQGASGNPALLILDERFARGEIDDDEYHRRRAILQTVR